MIKKGEAIKELGKEVSELLSKVGFSVNFFDYPEEKRSIDLGAINEKGKTVMIKVAKRNEDISREEIEELKLLSLTTESSPLAVIDESGDEIDDSIIDERNGVPTVTTKALETYIKGEKLFLYRKRGEIFVKLDPDKVKESRLSKRMSLGELAEKIKVSRKSVVDYEAGNSDTSIEVGLRMLEELGEKILGNIDIMNYRIEKCNLETGKRVKGIKGVIMELLSREGFIVSSLRNAPIDLIGLRGKSEKICIGIEEKDPIANKKKMNDMKKLKSIKKDIQLIAIYRSGNTRENNELDYNLSINNLNDIKRLL